MPLLLNEEQTMLRDSARGFIGDKAPVSHFRQLRDSQGCDRVLARLLARVFQIGFAGLLVPEAFGGSGLGAVEAGVVMEEIGRTLMPSPFFSTAVLGVSALNRRQRRAEVGISDKDRQWRAAGGAGHRRRREASPAANGDEGRALRQWLQAERREGLCRRWPHRRSPDRRGAQCRCAEVSATASRCFWSIRRPRVSRSSAPRWWIRTMQRGSRSTNVEVTADSVLGDVDQGGALLDSVLNIGRGAVAAGDGRPVETKCSAAP